jgi:hypothetical protein
MNPRVLPLVALLAAVAVCVFYFLLPSSQRDAAGGAGDSQQVEASPGKAQSASDVGENSARGNSSGADGKKSLLNWKHLAAIVGGDLELPKITAEDAARFLAKHGETPANLIEVFGLTHDRRLLDRALELFPNSPQVLMIAIREATPSSDTKPDEIRQLDAQRTALIERFKAADPNNPVPWIYSATELFKTKQNSEAITEIRAALMRPGFYAYTNEQWDAARQLYEETGMSGTEADFFAMIGIAMPHLSAANQASRSLMELQKSATESGDAAAAADAIRLNYDLGRTFATPEASRTLIGQLVGFSMEKRALESLPVDAQPDWLTVTLAQRLAEIETQRQNIRTLSAEPGLEWLIKNQDEQLLAEYLRRNRSNGEFFALTWLKAQKK